MEPLMKRIFATSVFSTLLLLSTAAYAEHEPMHPGHPGMMSEKLAGLPESKQSLIKASMQEGRKEAKPIMEKIHALHGELKTIATATQFDKGAFLEKSKQLQALHNQLQSMRNERIAMLGTQLSAEERKSLIGMMGEAPHHREHGKGEPKNQEKPE
jgi:uncharacterized membrane protein